MLSTYRTLTYRHGNKLNHLMSVPYGEIEDSSWAPAVPNRIVSAQVTDQSAALEANPDMFIQPVTMGCSRQVQVDEGMLPRTVLGRAKVIEGTDRIAAIKKALKGPQRQALLLKHLPIVLITPVNEDEMVQTARDVSLHLHKFTKAQELITRPSSQDAVKATQRVIERLDWWDLVETTHNRPTGAKVYLLRWLIEANCRLTDILHGWPRDRVFDWIVSYWENVSRVLKPYWADRNFMCNTAAGLMVIGELGREVLASARMHEQLAVLGEFNWSRESGDFVGILTDAEGRQFKRVPEQAIASAVALIKAKLPPANG